MGRVEVCANERRVGPVRGGWRVKMRWNHHISWVSEEMGQDASTLGMLAVNSKAVSSSIAIGNKELLSINKSP